MREKDTQEAARAMYEVQLLHSADTCHSVRDVSAAINRHTDDKKSSDSSDTESDVTLRLRWKSIDRKTNPDTLPCKCVHRVTPLDVTSNPTMCLMKHLVSGWLLCMPND